MSSRDSLLKTTKELLWDRGYDALSPRTIQAESGTGQGSFYHHFRGKEDLACHAVNEMSKEMREALQSLFATDKKPMDRIRDYLLNSRAGLRGCRLGKLAQEEAVVGNSLIHPIAEYFSYLEEILVRTLEQAKQEGELEQDIALEALAAMIASVVQGGYVLSRARQNPQQMDMAVNGAWDLLERMKRRPSADV